MKNEYGRTIRSCFVGYVVQAIVNNFAPLLFVTFSASFGLGIERLTVLTTVNFFLQLVVDFSSTFFIDKIGYRNAVVFSHACVALGLVAFACVPFIIPPFIGLVIAVCLCAVGGGLLEVVVSPIVEACPGEGKERRMSLLHSFYCWGSVAVILFSSLYFLVFGAAKWRVLALAWAVVPVVNGIFFLFSPFASLIPEEEKGLNARELVTNKTFLLLAVVIACAGATEAAIAQWASAFVEKSFSLDKAVGDAIGPALFAFAMGTSRALYGKGKGKKDLSFFMALSAVGCFVAYFCVSLIRVDFAAVIGMALCGFSVGALWPGTYSLASASIKNGGNAMFSLLAFAGDFGCMCGPAVVGAFTGVFGGDFRTGILAASFFPLILFFAVFLLRRRRSRSA